MIYPQAEDQQRAMNAAEPLLRVFHDDLRASYERYWSEEYSEAARAEHRARTQANIVYDHAERLLRQREDEIPGLKILGVRGLTLANYRDRVVFRLKKVDADGYHANVPTGQQLDFDEQLSFSQFPNEAFRLIAGYEPDPTATYIQRIMIVRQIGDTVYWTAQVNVIDEVAKWEDATPPRLFNLDLTGWRPPVRRRGRGG